MFRVNLENRRFSEQFIFILLIVLGSWLFFQVISLLTGLWIFNIGMGEVPTLIDNLDEPNTINFLKYIQTISSIGLFAVPSLIIASMMGKRTGEYLELDRFPAYSVIILASLIMVLSLPLNNLLSFWNSQLQLPSGLSSVQEYFENKEEQGGELMKSFLDNPSKTALIINLFVIAVVPSFAEELFFRGILQKLFINWTKNVHIGILITGLVFGLLHFQFLSAVPRIFQGIIIGYLFYWTKSLWIPIIAHLVNNSFAVLFYFYYYKGKIGGEMEELGTPERGYYYALIAGILIAYLLIVIRRRMKEY